MEKQKQVRMTIGMKMENRGRKLEMSGRGMWVLPNHTKSRRSHLVMKRRERWLRSRNRWMRRTNRWMRREMDHQNNQDHRCVVDVIIDPVWTSVGDPRLEPKTSITMRNPENLRPRRNEPLEDWYGNIPVDQQFRLPTLMTRIQTHLGRRYH
jgi:hypothetical protein